MEDSAAAPTVHSSLALTLCETEASASASASATAAAAAVPRVDFQQSPADYAALCACCKERAVDNFELVESVFEAQFCSFHSQVYKDLVEHVFDTQSQKFRAAFVVAPVASVVRTMATFESERKKPVPAWNAQ